MAKFRSQKPSFISGEISPTAFGRTDLPQYLHGCKTLRNMLPMLSGGAYRRPGTKFELSLSGGYAPKLFPFIYSNTEAYVCAIDRDTVNNKTVVSACFARGNQNLAAYQIPGGEVPYQVATSANGLSYDEWHSVQTAQIADVLWLVHPKYKPQKLYRLPDAIYPYVTFAVTPFDQDSGGLSLTGATFRDSYPYLTQNATATTMAVNTASIGTGRTVTFSTSVLTGTNADIGRVFKSKVSSSYGCLRITAKGTTTSATAEVIETFGGTTAVTTWWESAWSDYRGWPGAVSVFQNRLAYGGNTNSPNTVWFSESDDYNQLSHDSIVSPVTGATGTQAFSIVPSSNRLNKILWLHPGRSLLVGTREDEWVIDKEKSGGFGGDNASIFRQSGFGSANNQPIQVGNELVYLRSSQDELHALVFNDTENAYVDQPLQLFFDHYPTPEKNTGNRKIRSFAWDSSRSTLWCCDTNGYVFALTRDRVLGVAAWSSHRLGGHDESVVGSAIGSGSSATVDPIYSRCNASVSSVCVIPNPSLGTNDVWFAVKRKYGSGWYFDLERIVGRTWQSESAFDYLSAGPAVFLTDGSFFNYNKYPSTEDYVLPCGEYSGAFYTDTAVGTAFGQNGIFYVTGVKITGNKVQLNSPYPPGYTTGQYIVTVGQGFDSYLEPLRPDIGSQIGTAQGAIKRIHEVNVRFYRTLLAKIGKDASNLETLVFREGSTPLGKSPELFTGDKRVKIDSDYDRDAYMIIMQDRPLPFAVVSISSEGLLYD